jgi:hypothetical protein
LNADFLSFVIVYLTHQDSLEKAAHTAFSCYDRCICINDIEGIPVYISLEFAEIM